MQFKNKFKAVVLTYIASQLYSNRDKKELQRIFQEIDTDNDGVIEREELLSAYQQHYDQHLSIDVSNILKLVDINGSGKIDYTEFLVAASSEEKLVNAARLDDAFAFFDTVRNGSFRIIRASSISRKSGAFSPTSPKNRLRSSSMNSTTTTTGGSQRRSSRSSFWNAPMSSWVDCN